MEATSPMQNASWGGAEGRVFLEEGGVGHGRSMISKLSGGVYLWI